MLSPNGQQTQLKVKVIFDTDIRQWRYPITKRYESLLAFVQTSFRMNNFLLQYTDDEGDRLTIATETDITEAYNACKEQCRRSLRIFVTEKISFNKTQTQTQSFQKENNTESIEFHFGTICSNCKASPMQGTRYKCCICPNCDLCSKCESMKDIHDRSHPFIKFDIYKNKLSRFGVSANNTMLTGLNEILNNLGLTIAVQREKASPPRAPQKIKTVKRRFENKNKAHNQHNQPVQQPYIALSAELIDDLTLKDGKECIMDHIERKKWRLRNNGTTEWGYNVELISVKGYDGMVLNKRISVSNCAPGKITDVQCSIKIPNKSGRYVVYYRLYSDNVAFGPVLTVDIVAVDEHKYNRKHRVPEYKDEERNNNDNNNPEIVLNDNGAHNNKATKGRRLSMILSANIPSISCVCGEYLMATRPSTMYGNAQIVFCIECSSRCASNDTIYHCAMDRNSVHPRGYDLCNKCYESRLMSAYNEQTAVHVHVDKEEKEKEERNVTHSDVIFYKSEISELRNVFPRFYLVSDVDMVRLIVDPSPWHVGTYLHVLFCGLDGFLLDEDNSHIILGLRAVNGEILRFGRCINVDHKSLCGALDKWLLKIEYQMRYSMSILLEESFADYAVIENSDFYFKWISHYPTQIILITKRCLWCKTIEYFLTQKKNKNLNLNECLKEIKAEINLLSSYVHRLIVSSSSSSNNNNNNNNNNNCDWLITKSKIGALIQQLVYQRDVTALLIKQCVTSASDPVWISKMRTYYLTDDNMLDQYNIFKKLFIKCNAQIYYYGYEFYGDISTFIYSRSINSDSLFPQYLAQSSVNPAQICNVYGDIGTGKAESIRVFAYDLGRACCILSDTTLFANAQVLFNWFCAISSLGAFAILTQNVMSKFGGQVSYFAASINYHLNEHKNHMIINERRVALHSSTRIFIVTKKKLLFSNDSNDIMSKIVKGIAMPSSNKVSITHTLLSANGFQSAEILAPKIAVLLELCVTLLITENSYDFGFKLIMKIANNAGNALCDYIQRNPARTAHAIDDIPLIDGEQQEPNRMDAHTHDEHDILINSLCAVMFAMLNHSDCILFESLMESAFPQNNIDWNKHTHTDTSTISSNNSLNNNYFQFNKELHHLIMMGFNNIKKCKQMLIKHGGNTQAAMNELFAKSMV